MNVDDIGDQPITVSGLMQTYFMGQELDGSNQLYCDKCRGKKPAVSLPEPDSFAEYLVTTISIFKYQGAASSKISKPLNFEFSLNFKNILPKFVVQDLQYDLYAFILHIGTGVERGHYQCFARNIEENPMLWYKFDDHYVTEQEINRTEDFHFGYEWVYLDKMRRPTSFFTRAPIRTATASPAAPAPPRRCRSPRGCRGPRGCRSSRRKPIID